MTRRLTSGLAAAVCTAAVAAACGGTTVTEVSTPTSPTGDRCQTTVSAPPQTLPASGARVALTVVASRECPWTATSDASWAQVSPTSGQGEATLTVTVGANPEARARAGAVTINDQRLSLSQEAAPCRFDLSSSSTRMSHEGGRTGLRVSTLDGCEWRASSPASWVHVATDSGTGSGTVDLEVRRNDGPDRSVTLSVAGHEFTVIQEAMPPTPTPTPTPTPPTPTPIPPPNPSPIPPPLPGPSLCVFVLDDSSRSFGPQAGEGSVRVITTAGCAWTASSGAGWITIVSGGNGSGTGTVTYRVTANTSTSERSGTITAAGRTHTVRQAGAEPQRVDFNGKASNVSGSCPNVSFTAAGRSVITDSNTRFKGEGCSKLKNGVDVKVEGVVESGGRIRAIEVDVD